MAKQPKAPTAPDPAPQPPAPAPDPAPPGADQLAPLVARIAELEAENEDLKSSYSAYSAKAEARILELEAERDALKPHVRLRAFAFRLPGTNERKIVRAPNLPAARAQLHPKAKFTGFID